MFFYSDEYKANISKAWHSFIEASKSGKEMDPDLKARVRPEILDAWVRSRDSGVNPFVFDEEKIVGDELKWRLRENDTMISASREYIESLYSFLSGFNFVIMLTDKDGVVLYVKAEESSTKIQTDSHALNIGSIRSDEYAGSNAMGTCLRLGEPIQYWGEEHYSTFNHPFICSAAPIRNPQGEIIGSLDITGPKEELNDIVLSIVVSAVEGIERMIKLEGERNRIAILNSQLTSILQQIPYGVISTDQDGVITQYNKQALKLLQMPAPHLDGMPLSSLVASHPEKNPFADLHQEVQNKNLEFETKLGVKLSLSMSTTNIYDDKKRWIGVLILLQELKTMHTMVSRLSGFTAKYNFDSIIGSSMQIKNAKHMAELAAKGESNVLIIGESGTGKELFAQAIHNASERAAKPFIAINCGGLPQGLIESELFGYEKGAFTGANRDGQPGKFELADEGTIFLDEIGNMALDAQAALLRVIQSRELMRIGSSHMKKIDVRIIAATNMDLEKALEENYFREDLFYRLNVMTIELPPLREHPEDIPILTDYFIKSHPKAKLAHIKGISRKALNALRDYSWPGNIRELENVIERAMNLCETQLLELRDLPKKITEAPKPKPLPDSTPPMPNRFLYPPMADGQPLSPLASDNRLPFTGQKSPGQPGSMGKETVSSADIVEDFSKNLIIDALTKTNGNVTEAATLLDISRRTMYYKIKKYRLNPNLFRR